MTKDKLQRANINEYNTVMFYEFYREWGNAKGKRKVKKQLRRFGRRKLNQNKKVQYE